MRVLLYVKTKRQFSVKLAGGGPGTTEPLRFYFSVLEFWSDFVCEMITKGQTKSKQFFQADVSSKKRTNKFYFTTMKPQVDLFLFIFWRKLKTPKRHFEINWPLTSSRKILLGITFTDFQKSCEKVTKSDFQIQLSISESSEPCFKKNTFFDYFNFLKTLFSKMMPTFCKQVEKSIAGRLT